MGPSERDEVELLAQQLGVSPDVVPEMLAVDCREQEILPLAWADDINEKGNRAPMGAPYTIGTVDAYLAAVIKLYNQQVAFGENSYPHP